MAQLGTITLVSIICASIVVASGVITGRQVQDRLLQMDERNESPCSSVRISDSLATENALRASRALGITNTVLGASLVISADIMRAGDLDLPVDSQCVWLIEMTDHATVISPDTHTSTERSLDVTYDTSTAKIFVDAMTGEILGISQSRSPTTKRP